MAYTAEPADSFEAMDITSTYKTKNESRVWRKRRLEP